LLVTVTLISPERLLPDVSLAPVIARPKMIPWILSPASTKPALNSERSASAGTEPTVTVIVTLPVLSMVPSFALTIIVTSWSACAPAGVYVMPAKSITTSPDTSFRLSSSADTTT